MKLDNKYFIIYNFLLAYKLNYISNRLQRNLKRQLKILAREMIVAHKILFSLPRIRTHISF